MKILEKPFTQLELNVFIDECNKDGKLRVERYDGNVYAMYDYEVFQDGKVMDLRGTKEYEAEQAKIQKERRIEEIYTELAELDKKRIRAVCEPDDLRDDGTPWLEYYNKKIFLLREELSSL